jgi:hypothetical protein
MYHVPQKYLKMNLKEFLISIGRLPDNEDLEGNYNKMDQKSAIPPKDNQINKYKTIGDIFDYYKENGNESLPDNIQINVPGWPGRPFKGESAIFNKKLTNKKIYKNEI